MTTVDLGIKRSQNRLQHKAMIGDSLAFDWLATLVLLALVAGVMLDGWAHMHGRVDTTFFTPWHAIMYSGFLLVLIVHVGMLVINRLRGYPYIMAAPRAYRLPLFGVGLFALSGFLDMLWHTVFGIEKNIQANFSPTHLILAVAMGLLFAGPAFAAWHRADDEQGPTLFQLLPALISLALVMAFINMIAQYASPFGEAWPSSAHANEAQQSFQTPIAIGAASIMLYSVLLVSMMLLVLRRWKNLPFGSWTIVLTLSVAIESVLYDQYRLILAAAIAGICIDLMLWKLRVRLDGSWKLRVFCFLSPVSLFSLYFLDLQITGGVWWVIHVWSGSIALAGIVGVLMSYVICPPAQTR